MVYKFENSPYYLYSEPDITLVIGSDEKIVEVHERVIAPPSGFFKTALKIGFKETHDRKIKLPEISWDCMEEVLNWLYREDISNTDFITLLSDSMTDKLRNIFRSIDFLSIPGMVKDYQKMVESLLNERNQDKYSINGPNEGQNAALLINQLYAIGGSINVGVLKAAVILMRNGTGASRLALISFRGVIDNLEDPHPKFLHDICKVFGQCL